MSVGSSLGLRAGDQVLAVNGATTSTLDLDLLQGLFRHQNLQLLLRREGSSGPQEPAAVRDAPDAPTTPSEDDETPEQVSFSLMFLLTVSVLTQRQEWLVKELQPLVVGRGTAVSSGR